MILSCRTAAYNYIFPHFRDAEIADFSKTQVDQFVTNWFHEAKPKGQRFLRDLELPKNRGIADLCPTPLLLTLLCLAFEDTQSFPANRAELYKDALDALMKKWDSSRSVIRESAYKSLSLAKKELLLSRLAFGTFEKNRYFIKQDWLEREIADFLQNLKGAPKEVLDYEGERVLKEIEAQHGLLVERAYRIYSFSHLTFQEFFAARYITENTNKIRGPAYLVDKYLLDPRWNEVFVLSTGLLAEADSFLSDIRLKLSGIMKNASLRDLLTRICMLIRTDSKIPEPVRRALAVRFVASNLVRISSSFNHLLHACDELLPDVQKEFGEIVNPELESLKLLQVGLDENRERLDAITQEIADLHHEQAGIFAAYIRGTRLLVNCLNVDAYVSMAVRKEIVRGIFEEPWTSKLCTPLAR